MINKTWIVDSNKLVANSDTTKKDITDERREELLSSLIRDTENLLGCYTKGYEEFVNSDLDSCRLRISQNLTQLKKIKNSYKED